MTDLINQARELCEKAEVVTPKQAAHDLIQLKGMATALAALREQFEREKGCEYCLQCEEMAYAEDGMKRKGYIYLDGNLLTADLYSDSMAVAVCFCPMCGRRLTKEAQG